MKLLVIGSGLMGSAAAYDMARAKNVESVTLADADARRLKAATARVNSLTRGKKVRGVTLDAADAQAAAGVMAGHDAVLSAVPYFYNVGLARAAIEAGCHFADLGGNTTVVRKTYAMASKAERRGVALAPDCGLSPGMASVLAGELVRRMNAGEKRPAKLDALKIYVGGLPRNPKPPFFYQLVFSIEGLINEYVEPARVLRRGKVQDIEPLTEPEDFRIEGFEQLVAFHTSGGTSTLPETFAGQVGECFEKTLRYPSHFAMVRSLYDLGMFSSEKLEFAEGRVSPREMTSRLFLGKMSGSEPDVTIMRIEAHRGGRVLSFTMVDHYQRSTGLTSMMRTTAWPASIVVQMLASGVVSKRGAVRQEVDVPAAAFLDHMRRRGIHIEYAEQV